MNCCLATLAVAFPRLAFLLVVLLSDYIGRAYDSLWVPLLGFFFLPLTTMVYAWAINTHGELRGWPTAIVLLAALVDATSLGKSRRRKEGRKRKKRKRKDD
ncbi:MAG: hypothetical protein AAF682_01125 [Planctomycetota bacterium]